MYVSMKGWLTTDRTVKQSECVLKSMCLLLFEYRTFNTMSITSSDSEDENIDLLRQAVDTNFISDGMFKAGNLYQFVLLKIDH